MTVSHFQNLDEVEQLKVLIQFGILIGERTEKNIRIFVYQVGDFHIEAKYSLQTDDLICIDPSTSMGMDDKSEWNILYPRHLRTEKFTD